MIPSILLQIVIWSTLFIPRTALSPTFQLHFTLPVMEKPENGFRGQQCRYLTCIMFINIIVIILLFMWWLYSLPCLKVIATVCGEEERGFLEKNYPNIGELGILVTFSTYRRGGKYKREEVVAFSHSKKLK